MGGPDACPFHQGYGRFSSEQRLCAYADMRAERDRLDEKAERLEGALREMISWDWRGNEPNYVRVAKAALRATQGGTER